MTRRTNGRLSAFELIMSRVLLKQVCLCNARNVVGRKEGNVFVFALRTCSYLCAGPTSGCDRESGRGFRCNDIISAMMSPHVAQLATLPRLIQFIQPKFAPATQPDETPNVTTNRHHPNKEVATMNMNRPPPGQNQQRTVRTARRRKTWVK